MSNEIAPRFIRSKDVEHRTTYSNQHRLRMEAAGEFPKRIRLGPKTVVYLENEITAWINSRIRGGGRLVPRGKRRKAARTAGEELA